MSSREQMVRVIDEVDEGGRGRRERGGGGGGGGGGGRERSSEDGWEVRDAQEGDGHGGNGRVDG